MITTSTEKRGDLLERSALDAAKSWAAGACAELAKEGRRVEGGWPGTMPEARTRAAAEAARSLAARSMTALTHDELNQIARITYNEARRSWVALSR